MGFAKDYVKTVKANVAAAAEESRTSPPPRDARRKGPSVRFSGQLSVKNGEIRHRGKQYPLAGAHATVDTAGEIDRRVTATRLVLTGALALGLRKTKDRSQLFILVAGPGFGLVEEVDPKLQRQAREFATKLNGAAAESVSPKLAAAQVPPKLPWGTIMRELEELGRERAAGRITESEYAAAKAKLLEP